MIEFPHSYCPDNTLYIHVIVINFCGHACKSQNIFIKMWGWQCQTPKKHMKYIHSKTACNNTRMPNLSLHNSSSSYYHCYILQHFNDSCSHCFFYHNTLACAQAPPLFVHGHVTTCGYTNKKWHSTTWNCWYITTLIFHDQERVYILYWKALFMDA